MSAEEEIKKQALLVSAVTTSSVLLETSLGALVIDLFGADCPALTGLFVNLVRCKFWHGCTACELIPDVAVFFAHRDDTHYEKALTTLLVQQQQGTSHNTFYSLLGSETTNMNKARVLNAAIEEEGRLASKRRCTTIDVARTFLTDTRNLPSNTMSCTNTSSSSSSVRRIFERATATTAPAAATSPAALGRAGLLIVDCNTLTATESKDFATASCRMKFGLTLSNRNMDFLASRYIAIGQVREGWPLLLRRLRSLPCRDIVPTTTTDREDIAQANKVVDNDTKSIVLPAAPRWPRPIRLLRIKHCTVLPTPGTEPYRDVHVGNNGQQQYFSQNDDNLPDVARSVATGSSNSNTSRMQEQQLLLKNKLGLVLHSAGCFRFWASSEDIVRANATLRALLAQCQPPMLVLIPELPKKDSTSKDSTEENGEDSDEVRSIEYNAHYSGCYLSSDEELSSDTHSHTANTTAGGATQQSGEKARKALREAAQRLHEEKANETLALMLNVLNRVADVDGAIAPPENVLFVCKLNPVTTGEGLAMCFAQFGEVLSAEVIMDHKTKQSLCYGFVEFATVEACYRAFQKMDRALIDDSRIHVDFSQSVSKLWAQRQRELRKRARST